MSARLHVVSALLLVALCVLLSARTTTAMTAMEDLILSQRNYSGVSGFFHPSFAVPYANHTLPTPVMLYNATVGTRIQVLSQDPYILTQAHADYLQSTLPDSRTFMSNPVRASMVRGCTAVHAVCCSYYWVTDAYPPGLSLSEIDPSLILWNGTGTSMPINFSYATRFSSVNCSATDDSLIPAALRRPISMYNVPALSRFAMGAPLVWDFFGPDSYGAPLYRLLEIPLALNAGNATVRAFLQQQFAAVVTPIVDPWKVLGEDAMHLTLDTGDNLVATNRSSALGYIPVVAPVVVCSVLLALILLFTIILCGTHCRSFRDEDAGQDAPAQFATAAPAEKVRSDSFRRRAQGMDGEVGGNVHNKRISPDSAMSSTPSQLQRVSSNSSIGSQRSGGGGMRTPAPRRPSNGGMQMGNGLQRQGSFQNAMAPPPPPRPGYFANPMLPRTSSQGSLGSRNGSFRVNMATLPPPPMPPTMSHYDPQQQQQQQQQMMMMMAAQGRQSPFLPALQPSPVTMFPPQPLQQPQTPQFMPQQPGFASSWQPSPPSAQPLSAGPTRRLSQANLRADRSSAPPAPAAAQPQSPSGSILQKTSSFRRNASSSSIGDSAGQGSKRGSVTAESDDKFANPLAPRRPTFV